jgi:NADH-quinone oxidoreductase subunit C
LSEDHKEEEKKVKITEDGKATPTDETVEKIEEIQQANPKKQTTSEPTDSPASELKEEAKTKKEPKAEESAKADDKEAKTDEEIKAERAKARAERDKARAKKKAEAEAEAAEETPKEPSPHQPRLDRIIAIIKENISEEAIEESFINEVDGHLPNIFIKSEYWTQTAELLKEHNELKLNYLRNVSGVDHETHLEVVYHLLSLSTKHEYCIKVKTDRETPSIPSVTPIWTTAIWNEREIFDLLGIDFPGHPDMRRIMMSDDWVGHPLRKDYEPFDPEV